MNRDEKYAAFDAVYDALFNDVYAYFRLCFGEQTAEDLAQEIFLRVWQAIDDARVPEQWRAWVFRCAVNLKNDWLRRKYADAALQEKIEPAPQAAPIAGSGDEKVAVAQALAALPEWERELLIFKNAGLTSAEIGELLKLSASAVRTRLQKAKQDFKERLEAEGI